MRSALVLIFLALIVVFAGCNGVFGGNSRSTETLTPAQVPTDEPTPTPVPQLAPGLTGAGIENGSALVAAHRSIIRNQSFVVRGNSTFLATNGSVLGHGTSTLRAGPAGESYHLSQRTKLFINVNATYPVSSESWWNGKQYYRKQTFANGTTRYTRFDLSDQQTAYGYVYDFLPQYIESLNENNTVVTGQVNRSNTTLYRVEVTGSAPKNGISQLLVDPRGVIYQYIHTQQIRSQTRISRIVSDSQLLSSGGDKRPKRPPWVDEAKNQTTPPQPTEMTTEGELLGSYS